MWQKILSLVRLVARVCCLNSDPVTVQFFLAHATRTFGPHKVVDRTGRFQLPPRDLNFARIQGAIVDFVEEKHRGRFPVYSELRLFQVTAAGRVSKYPPFAERLSREDGSLFTATSTIVSQSNIVHIAAIYVDHLVPQIPPGVNLARSEREQNVAHAKRALAPSELAKNLPNAINGHFVLTGRPLDVTTPDPSIFSPPSAYLSQALNGPLADPDPDTLHAVTELFLASAVVYDDENARYEAVRPLIEKIFGVTLVRQLQVLFEREERHEESQEEREEEREEGPGTKRQRRNPPSGARADGAEVIAIQGVDACLVIVEVKNELGMGGAGDFQVGATHMKFMAHPRFDSIRESTPCPTILFGVSGTTLHVGYGILADAFISKPIDQHWFPLGGATPKQQCTNIQNLARIVPAVRRAIEDLRTFYTPTGTRPPPYLPNPTPVDPSNSRIGDLNFSDKLSRDASRLLFRATFRVGADNLNAIVKFCDNYGHHAHRHLARNNLAPELFHTEDLVGGLTMVIMEFQPDMMSAYDKYFGRALPESVIMEVDRALNILHTKDTRTTEGPFVHGDIRRENILVPRDADRHTPIQLVGFRWSGELGQVRYPYNVFLGEVRGILTGRRANQVITNEHDTQMRNNLSTVYT